MILSEMTVGQDSNAHKFSLLISVKVVERWRTERGGLRRTGEKDLKGLQFLS